MLNLNSPYRFLILIYFVICCSGSQKKRNIDNSNEPCIERIETVEENAKNVVNLYKKRTEYCLSTIEDNNVKINYLIKKNPRDQPLIKLKNDNNSLSSFLISRRKSIDLEFNNINKCKGNKGIKCEEVLRCLTAILEDCQAKNRSVDGILKKGSNIANLINRYKNLANNSKSNSGNRDNVLPEETSKKPISALKTGYSAALINDSDVSYFLVDLADKTKKLTLFLTDERGEILGNIGNLRASLAEQQKQLLFATNGGMFQPDFSPQGLFIRNRRVINPVDTQRQLPGNFYIEPNGIFLISITNRAHIVTTQTYLDHPDNDQIAYATQSGPMLLIDGKVNPNFTPGSTNRNIRNGVGVLADGKVVFAISNQPINFYDFALIFRNLGCGNALYLDGVISKMYVPKQREDQSALRTSFGPLIGVVADKN